MCFLEEAASYPITATDEAAEFYHFEFSSIYRQMRNMGIRESIAEDFKDVHERYISKSGKWVIHKML